MTDPIHEMLAQRPWLLADGATGTNLFLAGLGHGDAPELWNVERTEPVYDLAKAFVDAGADIILTNSFGGTRHRLKLHKAEDRVGELNAASARLARRAADSVGRRVLVAGSIGPTGELFQPLGPLTEEDGVAAFREQAEALAEGGCDLLWVETMSSVEELKAAVEGAGTSGLPIVCTMSFDTNGRTMMGVMPGEVAALVKQLTPRPVAYGGNCGVGAAELVAALLNMAESAEPDDLLVAKSNCGIPEFVKDEIHYTGTPELMADYARMALDVGARIIGGCCGTTPMHLAAMHDALTGYETGPKPGLEQIVDCLGAISTGATEQQQAGGLLHRPDREGRRRRGRRRETGSEDTPRF